MCSASGTWPRSHSPCSRTSRKSASPASRSAASRRLTVRVSLDVAIAFESVATCSMSPRARIWTIVATVCAVAVAATVGIVALTRDEPSTSAVDPPPLFLDLGVRDDAQARDVRRAAQLYADGRLEDARSIFQRYGFLEAKIGAAFASWPDTMPALEALPQSSSAVRL